MGGGGAISREKITRSDRQNSSSDAPSQEQDRVNARTREKNTKLLKKYSGYARDGWGQVGLIIPKWWLKTAYQRYCVRIEKDLVSTL